GNGGTGQRAGGPFLASEGSIPPWRRHPPVSAPPSRQGRRNGIRSGPAAPIPLTPTTARVPLPPRRPDRQPLRRSAGKPVFVAASAASPPSSETFPAGRAFAVAAGAVRH